MKSMEIIFAERLKNARTIRGLNQKDFADNIGADPRKISKYETGRGLPKYETLIDIANYLNVSIDYLLGRQAFLNEEEFYGNMSQAKKEMLLLLKTDSDIKETVIKIINN